MAKPDKATMLAYIDELGFSDALKANVLQELEADESRANNFVGQRLRQADYTRKTQELADQRKTLDTAVAGQVQEYAQKLQEADTKISNILKDLENEKISRATAETRLQRVAKQYEIPDEDIKIIVNENQPPPGRPTAVPGLTEDKLAEILAKREDELVKKLMPELMSFPRISAIQQEIRDQHYELTGKRLTAKEVEELMNEAPKAGGLVGAWEAKFGIAGIRQERHDREVSEKAVTKFQEEQKRKASEDAIASIHNQDSSKPISTSPVIRQYQDRSKDDAAPAANGGGNAPERRISGAERAAVKWTERRNQGIGLGKEAPAAKAS